MQIAKFKKHSNTRRQSMKKIRKTFISAVISVFMMNVLLASGTFAFNADDLKKLQTTSACERCDLQYAPLTGANLSGKNLSYANLSHAYLLSANLQGAILKSANFQNATMTSANLLNADVTFANFGGALLTDATWIDGSKCTSWAVSSCGK